MLILQFVSQTTNYLQHLSIMTFSKARPAVPSEAAVAQSPVDMGKHALAAKGKGKKVRVAPRTIQDNVTVSLDEISVGSESGWRASDPARVTELQTIFEGGEYGMNLLRKPSILAQAGQPLRCSDGLLKLADGKHSIQALLMLRASSQPSKLEEYSEALVNALTVGVQVSIIEFEDWDDDVTLAWAASAHDENSNRYKATSMQNLVAVALRFKQRVPDGTWQKTQAHLEQLYGPGRRMFVYRMVTAAKCLDPKVLTELASRSNVPNAYVHENKYFVGTGADAPKKLSVTGCLAAIEWVSSDITDGIAMSASKFATEYCAPLRHAEGWASQKKREFGKIADIPAFVRLTNFLYSSKARMPLLQCMKNGIRLEGNSDEQPGIQQCHVLVKEMHILKHGESKTNTGTASGGVTPSRSSDGEPNGDQAMDMACLEPEVSMTRLSSIPINSFFRIFTTMIV